MKEIGLIIGCCFFGICGQVFLKVGFLNNGGFWLSELSVLNNFSRWLINPIIIIGIFICGTTAFVSMYLLDRFELSYLYPWSGLVYVFAFIAGVLIFGEQVRYSRIIGTVVILIGIIIIAKT